MKKIAVLFGGKSSEHDVSIVSGTSIISNLDKNKYEIYPIYIDKNGDFYKYTKDINEIKILSVGDQVEEIEKIENIMLELQNVDVIFPVLHGLYGEDGTIQGLLELIGKPYVGCKVLASSLCMDKIYTKILFERAKINTAKGMYIKFVNNKFIYLDNEFNEYSYNEEELATKVEDYLKYPVFIKPSRQGSSVGVNKAKDKDEFIKYIKDAFNYDSKVLVEECIIGREVECAVLGNDELIVSPVGEVLSAEEFYTFSSKYKNSASRTVIPANIENNLMENIQKLAKKAYIACDCSGLSRVDFFIENNTNRIILNEINTLPGFTEISMYPKLIGSLGISYSELLDRLIELAK